MKFSVHTTKTNAETLVFASKEIGLEVNVDKNKYMVMFRDRDPRRSHNKRLIIAPLKLWKGSYIWEQN